MGLKLDQVIPWGRSLNEYIKMFNLHLSQFDRDRISPAGPHDHHHSDSILDCASGPASFNAEMTNLGYHVVSVDPIYQFTVTEIQQRITDVYDNLIEGVSNNYNDYVWQEIRSPAHLGEVRMAAMQQFLADYSLGLKAGRYQPIELPLLPFPDQSFDLALSSHFLFAYTDHFSWEFHQKSIEEMCRVATEVRIFPLLKVSGELSEYLSPIMETMRQQGYHLEVQTVGYEFQKGGNQMLKITR